jgi:hypothetical protein
LWWNIMEPNIAKRLKIGSSFFSPLKYNLFGDFGGVYTTFFRHTPKKTGLGLQNIIYIYIYTYSHQFWDLNPFSWVLGGRRNSENISNMAVLDPQNHSIRYFVSPWVIHGNA